MLPSPSRVNESENQTGTCPSGQLLASGASTFQQTRSRTNIASCPDPWGNPVWSTGSWSNWNPGPSDVCAPACSAPGPSSVQQTQAGANQSQTLGCAAGQTGSITQIRSVTQSRTATTTYVCPAPTGGFTSNTTYTGWTNSAYGAWQTTSNTCVSPPPPPPPPPAPTAKCAVQTDWTSGVSDGSDRYWSVYYTVGGRSFSCYSTLRDNPDSGYCSSRVLSLSAWEGVAQLGDTYSTSGSEGWGSGRDYWTWETHDYVLSDKCN